MEKNDLLAILSKGEDSFTEFKDEKVHPDDLAAEMVAFSNTEGGTLVIGVSDSGQIVGLRDWNKTMQRLDNVASQNCEPPVYFTVEKVTVENKNILVVRIPKGPQRPYRTNRGVYYVRVGSSKRPATREELLRLYQASRVIYYDELPVPGTSPEDLDLLYFRKFFEDFYQTRLEDFFLPKLLENMKVLTPLEDRLVFTVGGYLLFGRHPQKHFPYAKITVAAFAGEQIGEEFEKKDLEGKLEEQIQGVETLLKLYLRTPVRIRAFASERRFEIPLEALREGVINAVAHRNYHLPAQIRILIFADRIEIISPGKLPNTVTLENIRLGVHAERNPLLVSFLSKMGYMTQIGTGIIRMIRLLRQHTGKEPEFEERGEEFLVRIWRPQDPSAQ
jgi:ATP-dependent DNA helicase RecG